MLDTSFYNLKIDWKRSQGSYLYDKNSREKYLDFFTQYSTIPLGYNHPIFDEEFYDEIKRVANLKVANCEVISDEQLAFKKLFRSFAGKDYKYFYYCNGGGVAVENAIKVALDFRGNGGSIISIKNSFHGITGLSGYVTSRFQPVKYHFPYSYKIPEQFKHLEENKIVEYIEQHHDDISGVIIEPIQCTYGDHQIDSRILRDLRVVTNKYGIPLIFDCVQIGFGGTGTLWYYEQLDLIPDILIFGKKTQVCGIMSRYVMNPDILSVTWDGDVIDMIRCRYIMKAYNEYNILKNVKERSKQLMDLLRDLKGIDDFRYKGLLLALDFSNKKKRDEVWLNLLKNNMLVLKTRDNIIRLRPPLSVKEEEVESAANLIKKSIKIKK